MYIVQILNSKFKTLNKIQFLKKNIFQKICVEQLTNVSLLEVFWTAFHHVLKWNIDTTHAK